MRRLPHAALGLLLTLPLAAAQEEGPSPAQRELERTSLRIAGQLEKLRARSFERPFTVRVSTAEEFLAYALARTEALMPPEELAAAESLQKMLGLLAPDLDLMGVTLALLEEQVGGFYDPGKDAFYLMEGFEGGVAELILAHELTHALDDQLFDLDQGLAHRAGAGDAASAYHAVVEGSGMVMMTRWMMAHPPRLTPEALAAGMPTPESLGDAPTAIWKPLLFAYMQGQNFLEQGRRMLRRKDRSIDMNAVLDQAFLAPPRSTEQVLHPEKYWDSEKLDEPREVRHDLGALPEAWRVLTSDTLGELQLALVTEEPARVDFSNQMALLGIRYTNRYAEGWDGDQAVLLAREDGARLLSWALVFDTPADAAELAERLGEIHERIAAGLGTLAGEGAPCGLEFRIDPGRADLVRVVAFTGLEAGAALELARSLPITVGADPLAGPHDAPR